MSIGKDSSRHNVAVLSPEFHGREFFVELDADPMFGKVFGIDNFSIKYISKRKVIYEVTKLS
jgi:hypothetical protein